MVFSAYGFPQHDAFHGLGKEEERAGSKQTCEELVVDGEGVVVEVGVDDFSQQEEEQDDLCGGRGTKKTRK
jgi:hypothetical protein